MNTIENNKLIAEFMGIWPNNEGVYHISKHKAYHVENLSYHKSWDWLMPVVQKILDISFQDQGDAEDFYSIRDCMPDINHTYKAVVEFIKEYNK